jgi:hypothetical protein
MRNWAFRPRSCVDRTTKGLVTALGVAVGSRCRKFCCRPKKPEIPAFAGNVNGCAMLAVSFSTPSRNTTRPSLIHHHDVVMVSGLGRFGNTSPRCHPSFDRCFAVPVDPRGALIASFDTLADVVSRAVSEIP